MDRVESRVLASAEGVVLSATQTKIIVALARSMDHSLDTDGVIKETGIAVSTWSAEQSKLVGIGLLDKQFVRTMTKDGTTKRMCYRLTDRGKIVGLNLLNITRVMSASAGQEKTQSSHGTNSPELSVDFYSEIRECIEIGLDSFGLNLVKLVSGALETQYGIRWSRLSECIDELLLVLADIFGVEASKKMEVIFCSNLSARFGMEASRTIRLVELISEISKRNTQTSSQSSGRGGE